MRHFIHIIALTIFTIVFAACSRTPDSRLLSAESLMEQHPDSALAILEAIPDTSPLSELNRNIHRVLITEARYKTGIDETSDSLISIACNYFDSHPDSHYRLKAYLYKGIILKNRKDFANALITLQNLEGFSESCGDSVLRPFVNRAIGDVYDEINNPRIALLHYRKSLDGFKAIHKDEYVPGALHDLCRTYLNLSLSDSCIMLASKIRDFAREHDDAHLLRLSSLTLAHAHLIKKEYDSTIAYLEPTWNADSTLLPDNDIENLGLAYLNTGRTGEARKCEALLEKRKSMLKNLSYQIAEQEGDYKRALSNYRKFSENNFRIFSEWVNRSQESALLENYRLLQQNVSLEKERERQYLWILSLAIFACLISAFVIYIMWRYEKMKRKLVTKEADELREINMNDSAIIDNISRQLQTYYDLVQELDNTIKARDNLIIEKDTRIVKNEKSIYEIKETLRKSLVSRFAIIDGIAKELYRTRYDEVRESDRTLIKRVNKIFDSLRKETDGQSEIAHTVNSHLDGILDRFATDYPELNDNEKTLFMYIVLGLSGKSIGFFMGISDDNVYTRKKNLRAKISEKGENVSAPYIEYF